MINICNGILLLKCGIHSSVFHITLHHYLESCTNDSLSFQLAALYESSQRQVSETVSEKEILEVTIEQLTSEKTTLTESNQELVFKVRSFTDSEASQSEELRTDMTKAENCLKKALEEKRSFASEIETLKGK